MPRLALLNMLIGFARLGGYSIGIRTFDALIFGYYEGMDLIYVARTRNAFTPAMREELFKQFRHL